MFWRHHRKKYVLQLCGCNSEREFGTEYAVLRNDNKFHEFLTVLRTKACATHHPRRGDVCELRFAANWIGARAGPNRPSPVHACNPDPKSRPQENVLFLF